MNISKILAIAVLPILMFSLAGCDRGNDAGSGEKTLGVTLPNLTNPYYVAMKKSFEEYGKTQNLNVKVLIADNDNAKQLSQVQSFIQQKVDAVAVNCINSGPCVSIIAELNRANIPAFTLNILPDKDGMRVQNVTMIQGVQTDQFAGGKYIGEQLVSDLGDTASAKIGIVGDPTSLASIDRDDGFKEGISSNPNLQITALVDGKVEETTSLKVTTEMLQGNPDMTIIYADTEPAALGAIAAIKQLGAADRVKLYAFVDKEGVKHIQNNSILKAGAIQEPAKLAQILVDSVNKNFAGEVLPEILNSPPLLVDKSNADEVIDLAY